MYEITFNDWFRTYEASPQVQQTLPCKFLRVANTCTSSIHQTDHEVFDHMVVTDVARY